MEQHRIVIEERLVKYVTFYIESVGRLEAAKEAYERYTYQGDSGDRSETNTESAVIMAMGEGADVIEQWYDTEMEEMEDE